MNKESISKLYIYTDGASRGNPGPAAYAYIFTSKNRKIIEKNSGYIGIKTNNQAEYIAVLNAIKKSKDKEFDQIFLYSDSQLLVKQLNGEWDVNDIELKSFHEKIRKEIKDLKIVFQHVPRSNRYIKIADSLCNKMLDEKNH